MSTARQIDAHARKSALDVTQSFIVQAPAGSGKTELLTQRILALLLTVEHPENILAITFTKKAAAEMLDRLVGYLIKADDPSYKPQNQHEINTYNLAKKVLEHSNKQKWDLVNNNHRLQIMTIDSLNYKLNRAIPLLEQALAFSEINQKPEFIYKTAILNCIRNINESDALEKILLHLDNNLTKFCDFFINLTFNRNQVLPLIMGSDFKTLKQELNESLQIIVEQRLFNLTKSFPKELLYRLHKLIKQISADFDEWIIPHEISLDTARKLGNIVLTGSGQVRKTPDKHIGFTKAKFKNFSELKQEGTLIFSEVGNYYDIIDNFLHIKYIPDAYYSDAKWEILHAIFKIYPLIMAEIYYEFQQNNQIDYSGMAMQALGGLYDPIDGYKDLALYLDHQFKHLLIDEFQDTSLEQIQLIEHLIAGWTGEDGRTIFLVGDPMQSIYRFRQAEVGIFLKVQQSGIGNLMPINLVLSSNFRSSSELVRWTNQHFKDIFPKKIDITQGATIFIESNATKEANITKSEVCCYETKDQKQEAILIAKLVAEQLTEDPNYTIAILVKNRKHSVEIINAFKKTGIAYHGVDLDLLKDYSHVQDLWLLIQYILKPQDKLVYLSLLRSPLVGLSLRDLELIANEHVNISEDARLRIDYLNSVISNSEQQSNILTIPDKIIHIANMLHANKIYTKAQLDDWELVWQAITPIFLMQNIDLKNIEAILNELYVETTVNSNVQIMTIHKSKGLEFDCVFIPNLSANHNSHDAQLLRWLKLPTKNKNITLISPYWNKKGNEKSIYDYIKYLDTNKDRYELQRLLYVAATRAKHKLFLFDYGTTTQFSFRDFLNKVEFTKVEDLDNLYENSSTNYLYWHLPIEHYKKNETIQIANKISLIDQDATDFGTIIHNILQWIGTHHPINLDQIPWHIFIKKLFYIGYSKIEVIQFIEKCKNIIYKLSSCEHAKWILKNHEFEKNEWEIFYNVDGITNSIIIDRCFIDNNTYWIIDYKTGSLNHELHTKYSDQINFYKKILSRYIADNAKKFKISTAIYYLEESLCFIN